MMISAVLFFTMSLARAGVFRGCDEDPIRQAARSRELQRIVQADQSDRIGPVDWAVVGKRDEDRRKRVGEIFGEGCFSTAEDYAAAALVFQHGNLPEHAWQCFLWANEAVNRGLTRMGDIDLRLLSLSGVDRYLIGKKRKQLFATQSNRMKSNPECRCVQPVEATFSEERRVAAGGTPLSEALAYVIGRNAEFPACREVRFCDSGLNGTPAGTLPGVW